MKITMVVVQWDDASYGAIRRKDEKPLGGGAIRHASVPMTEVRDVVIELPDRLQATLAIVEALEEERIDGFGSPLVDAFSLALQPADRKLRHTATTDVRIIPTQGQPACVWGKHSGAQLFQGKLEMGRLLDTFLQSKLTGPAFKLLLGLLVIAGWQAKNDMGTK